jgi:large subunit ribosomal protein L25
VSIIGMRRGKMEKLNVKIRSKNSVHSAKKTRIRGVVPGILYGKELQSTLFEIGDLELNSHITKNGEHGTIEINMDGKDYKTLIKEIQRDPVTRKIIHMDLEALSSSKKVITEVPIHFSGENQLKAQGSIIQKEKTNIKVECTSDNIPSHFDIDISNLRRGEPFRVCDVEFGSEISVIDDLNTIIVSMAKGNTNIIDNVGTHDEDISTLGNKEHNDKTT